MRYEVRLIPILDADDIAVTKIDALYAKFNALDAAFEAAIDPSSLDLTPCNLTCAGCGEVLPTEYDFAKHFTVKRADILADRLNLGSCPKADK